MSFLIFPFFLLTAHDQYCYLTGNYEEKVMRLTKLEFGSSSSKQRSASIWGAINNQNSLFSLADKNLDDFIEYEINDQRPEDDIDYDNLSPLKLDVRVVQFGSSKKVVLIDRDETKEDATFKNLIVWILLSVIPFGGLLISYILKKTYEKKN